MVDEEGKKEEEKFDFTSEGESLGYISLDQARILAMRTATEAPGSYGPAYLDIPMAFEVVEAQETEDHYIITLSIRPPGEFAGTPGREQFFVEKEGTVRLRQILSVPVRRRSWIGLPSALLGIVVAVGVLLGVLFATGIVPPSSSPAPNASAIAVNTPVVPGAPTQLESPSGQVTIQLGVGAVDIPGLLWYQQLAPDQVPELPTGYLISDKVFDVSITGTGQATAGPASLIRPITISIRLSAEDAALAGGIDSNVVIQRFQQGDNRWVALNTTVDFRSSLARAQVSSLSVFALTIKRPEPGDTPVPGIPTSALQVTPQATVPIPTLELLPSPGPTFNPVPTPTPQPTPTRATIPTPTSAFTALPTPTPTPAPTSTPTPVPTPTAIPTPTATPTPTLIPTPSPTPVPVVVVKMNSVSRQDSPLILRTGYGAVSSVRLSTFRPQDLDAPVAEGTGYYGLLPLGTENNLGVMVDVISVLGSSVVGTAYFGAFADGSITHGQQQSFFGQANSGEIILLVDYGQESEFVSFRVDVYGEAEAVPVAVSASGVAPTPTPALTTIPSDDWSASIWANLYIDTLYIGQVPGASTFFLIDSSDSARFDTPQTRVLQDVDHDGLISGDVTGEVQTSANATIMSREEAWELVSIIPSGREVRLSPAGKGTLTGTIQTFVGAQDIAGATIQVWPGPFETVSQSDGSYSLDIHAGDVWKILVKKKGYVPFSLYGGVGTEPREFGAGQGSILIRRGSSRTYNVELAEIPEVVSGTASFGNRGSFHGALGLAIADETVGDFLYQVYQEFQYTAEDERRLEQGLEIEGSYRTSAQICACYDGQRGVVELGNYGSRDLELFSVPPIGYVVQRYLELKPGYIYVSKAREGLEGHFVVFRVDSISEESATVTYLFR